MEQIIHFMNIAEKRYSLPQLKRDFVIRAMLELHPGMTVREVKELIEVFITVSKLSTKILFNLTNSSCCSVS